jgi:hypothetical protein
VIFELEEGGFLDINRNADVLETVNGLGYPDYFVSILGVFKLLGVIVNFFPRSTKIEGMGICRLFL